MTVLCAQDRFAGLNENLSIARLRSVDHPPIGRVHARPGAGLAPDCFYYIPAHRDFSRAPLVCVHGISRNALEHIMAFRSLADEFGAPVAAPVFSKRAYGGYQTLGHKSGYNALAAFDTLLDEFGAAVGAAGSPVDLFGFSGGAQFAHRYAMARPARVRAIAIAAAGWYTMPAADAPFPEGLAGPRSPICEIAAFLKTPVLALAGSLDVARDANLRRGASIERDQGPNRLERARRWVSALNIAARAGGLVPPASFVEIVGAGHSFADCAEAGIVSIVGDFLHRRPEAARLACEGAAA